ncbi:HAD-IIA family hydrolase [Salinirubrum litoreum]|uniref:HAD-IIA family hydrolase n=1 Tax=Salinirubrum litoreum TaxID=1126234 RepID=A0ABD5RBZ7_9EURY
MTDPPVEGALVDLDGTVFRGDPLIEGADDAVATLRAAGVSVLFLSNKATRRRAAFAEKLRRLGIDVDDDGIVNSALIAASYLETHHPDDPVFVVGEPPLRDELRAHGLTLTDDPEEAAVVLASMDRQFDYGTLTKALHAVDEETVFLATNPDRTCPTEGGEIPDCAGVVGAIEGVTGTDLDRYLGKPAQTAVDAALSGLDLPASRCLMVGDRLETDVRMANRAGMTSVLVLTGVTDRETLARSSIQPDYVLESIADIGQVLRGE